MTDSDKTQNVSFPILSDILNDINQNCTDIRQNSSELHKKSMFYFVIENILEHTNIYTNIYM